MGALLDGLAVNPAAPADLLLRLLREEYESAWYVLASRRASFPEEVTAAIVTHPHPRVRGALARNPFVDPEVRGLLVDDQEWLVRARLVGRPDRTRPVRPLPDWVIDRMLTTYDHDFLSELLVSRQIPFRLRRSYGTHPLASIRQMATGMWTLLSEDERVALLKDPHPRVRASAESMLETDDAEAMERQLGPLPAPRNHGTGLILVNYRLSRNVVDWLLRDPHPDNSWVLAHNHSTPPDVVAGLLAHPDPKVRLELAHRADLAPALVETLARDLDPRVRTAISLRPELTEDERAAIDYTATTDEEFGPIEHHVVAAPDPAVSAGYARSRHPLLRRRAARDPALPAELVVRLARDDDLGVRVLLAHNHPSPPPELLLRSYLEHRRPARDLLTEHLCFPVAGLGARFADADAPDERRLAVLDPGLAPGTADRLTRDPDPAIRAGAARHPRLPAGRLLALLDDEELGEHAAANPALSVTVMRGLLTSTAVPSKKR
ncbi:translation initiation factor 2 [Streptomyces sp. LX-29]|uniref:translation initiation factor 2 n=1 Tax=Streptomyces sp. LX-29 TaxID=2900152 RepID=UPI00240E5D12|nr:translation initiation factor 2 [Streptomyces sp. LX-29]WFB05845.1 translation initiation factor 2 [Streptomyces sp. LX-29]